MHRELSDGVSGRMQSVVGDLIIVTGMLNSSGRIATGSSNRVHKIGPVLLVAAAVIGCAPYVTTANGARLRPGSEEFRAYAERVFRQHNEISTAMAYALDDTDGPGEIDLQQAKLFGADDRMMQACYALDEVAIARIDERRVTMSQLLSVSRTITECERATVAAAAVIAEIAPR